MNRCGTGPPSLVVVLGASGLIGSAVTTAFARLPVRLRVVSRRRAAVVPRDAVADVDVRVADLTAPGELAGAVADADVVVHLVVHSAGVSMGRVTDDDPVSEHVNLGLVRELVDVAGAGGPPPLILFAGTTSQVGLPDTVRIDGSEPDEPVTAYDRHKLAAERALEAATARGAVRGITLRLPTVYGYSASAAQSDATRAGNGVVPTMVRLALAGQPLTLWHDGAVTKDLIHVDDVAGAFHAALGHADALAGRHWLIGTGRSVPLVELFRAIAELVAEHTGRPPVPVLTVDAPAGATMIDFRSFEIDSTAFREVTGWAPATPLREGLRRTVAGLAGDDQQARRFLAR